MYDLLDGGMDPPALKNRPVVEEWMREYLDGFYTLSSSRTYGMGPNPIQFSEMVAYVTFMGVPDPHRFINHIRAMDRTYLEVGEEVRKQKQSSNDSSKAVTPGGSNGRKSGR